ncbi:MAG: hypothetical protein GY869_12870 [Planctomycetes bacterium]|nr:hypothetical protein [Planctomycetota bacterium]
MKTKPLISLDTNIIIVGLRTIGTPEDKLLRCLPDFPVRLARQVEEELRRNLPEVDMTRFYHMIYAGNSLSLAYSHPPAALVEKYKNLGLKKGDVLIAAFCEWQKIDIFISRNRHFLQGLPDLPFRVMAASTFNRRFLPDK